MSQFGAEGTRNDGRPRRRPTIDDVAAVAQVSRGTVSRYLNGGRWVSREASVAVEGAIRSTGYRVNAHARGLATARTGSVAFLLNESTTRLFGDPNFPSLISGVAEALSRQGQTLVLLLANQPADEKRTEEFLLGGHVDGALLVSWHGNSSGMLRNLHRAGFPVVACGIPLGMESEISWVEADDYGGARSMVSYLRSSGRPRIAHITGPQDTSGGVRRLQGYRDELGSGFEHSLVANGDYSAASGAAAMRELLARRVEFDAVFAANDEMAVAAIAELKEAGRSVPGDVAVGGFDDSAVALTSDPQLTTMRQPFGQISAEMVRLLRGRIDGGPRSTLSIDVELVRRGSA